MSYICIHFSRINTVFFKSDLIVCVAFVFVFFVLFLFCCCCFCLFVFFFFFWGGEVIVNITVFRVSIALPCIPITPISINTFLKMPELLFPLVHVCIATTAEV